MQNKLILPFGGTAAAKRYVEKVKALPFVTYATDYCRSIGCYSVMVCGQLGDEEIEQLKKMKKGNYK